MALTSYKTISFKPFEETSIYGSLTSAYNTALKQAKQKREEVISDFYGAEEPLQESVELFKPGGSYGAGQLALIEQQARQGFASGQANLMSTGMSSGTNVAGLRARITADTTTAKLGVEDTRVGQLANALALLSQLRTTKAQVLSNVQTPDTSSLMGALTSAYGTYSSVNAQALSDVEAYNRQAQQLTSNERMTELATKAAEVKQHFNTPW